MPSRNLAACHEGSGQQVHVDARGHRRAAAVASDVGRGRVQGNQRRRTSGVRGNTWGASTEEFSQQKNGETHRKMVVFHGDFMGFYGIKNPLVGG